MTAVGALVGIVLERGSPQVSQHVVLDVHTLLVAFACVLLGLQAIAFAFFAQIYTHCSWRMILERSVKNVD